MGRQIIRVPVDFDWPLEQTWAGYVNPIKSVKCQACDGMGESQEYKELTDAWYSMEKIYAGYRYPGTQYQLTQEEVNLLVDKNRLHDLASDYDKNRWVPRKNEDGSRYYPTAEEVNEWAKTGGHDGINMYVVCKHRANKAGIETDCAACKGTGNFWASEEVKKLHEDWQDTHPPKGEGWQVWETVGYGSPVTPVFETADKLIDYLCKYGDLWCQRRDHESPPTRAAAEAFVKGFGWVPSGAKINGEWKKDISICEPE